MMNITRTFGFLTIAVVLSSASAIVKADRWGDPCSSNAQCRNELACRNNRCTHPCEESFDEHATCLFRNNTWLPSCFPDYQFNAVSQKCEPWNPFPPGREDDRCSIDGDCMSIFTCIQGKCVHQCNKLLDQYTYCALRNNTWVSVCLPGYQYQSDSNKCEPMYSPEADPYRQSCAGGCESKFTCSAESQRCIHYCEFFTHEHTICILTDDDSFVHEPRVGYHWGSPGKSEPDCKADTECPSWLMCADGICVDPCMYWPETYSDCIVENRRPVRTCRIGFVRPPGFRECVTPTSLY